MKLSQVRIEEVEEIFQSPRKAVFCLFLGDSSKRFFPNKLTIIAKANFDHENIGFAVQIAIIGESHFLQLRRYSDNKIIYTELLACVDPRELGFFPDFSGDFKHVKSIHIRRLCQECRVSIRCQIEIGDKTKERRRFVPKIRDGKNTPGNRLKICFPGYLKPRTIVAYTINSSKLVVRTVHEYVAHDLLIEPITSNTTVIFKG